MQAVFRFRGDHEIVVSNQVNGVLVEVYEGMDPANMPEFHEVNLVAHEDGDAWSRDKHSPRECSRDRCGLEPWTDRRQTLLSLSKSEARSIASAIMGAAAEL